MLRSLKRPEHCSLAIGLALVVGLATALRLHGLGRWSLWLDELLQYKESAAPLNKLYGVIYEQDVPVSVLLGHALIWSGLNSNEWQLRLPFAIVGVGTVVLVFLLGRELLDRRAGFLAAVVACVMPVLVIYSQEYRSYSLFIFLTTLCGWSLAVALRKNHVGWWGLFIGSAILSLYTHFAAMFTVVGLVVFAFSHIVLQLRRGEPIWPALCSPILAFAIIGVAWIPAIPMFARLLSAEEGLHHVVATATRLSLLKTVILKYPDFEDGVRVIVASLAAIGVAWSAFRAPRALLFFIGAFAVPALLYAFFGYERASRVARYTLPLMAPFTVAAGAGLAAITYAVEALAARERPRSQRIGAIATAIVAVLFAVLSMRSLSNVYAANPKQLPVDLREGFDYLRSRIGPNDLLLEASTTKGGSVYWYPGYEAYYMREAIWPKPPVKAIIDDLNFPQGFKRFLDTHGRLWVIITVSDAEQRKVQERSGSDFAVQCFRRICVIQSRRPEHPMLEQMSAFFDRFADLDPKYFAASARAVQQTADPNTSPN